jgi:hypothetical protein
MNQSSKNPQKASKCGSIWPELLPTASAFIFSKNVLEAGLPRVLKFESQASALGERAEGLCPFQCEK